MIFIPSQLTLFPGVLTKPDRIAQGESYQQWARVLNNEEFHVGHGYFVTKQPSQSALDTGLRDHLRAREEEELFFATEEPWATDFAMHQHRFGTRNLQEALSTMLTEQITAR